MSQIQWITHRSVSGETRYQDTSYNHYKGSRSKQAAASLMQNLVSKTLWSTARTMSNQTSEHLNLCSKLHLYCPGLRPVTTISLNAKVHRMFPRVKSKSRPRDTYIASTRLRNCRLTKSQDGTEIVEDLQKVNWQWSCKRSSRKKFLPTSLFGTVVTNPNLQPTWGSSVNDWRVGSKPMKRRLQIFGFEIAGDKLTWHVLDRMLIVAGNIDSFNHILCSRA